MFSGEFKVRLPDGRLQITSYQADDDGYRPHITYTYDDADAILAVKKPHAHPGLTFLLEDIYCPQHLVPVTSIQPSIQPADHETVPIILS